MDSSTVLRNLAEIASLDKVTIEERIELISFELWVFNNHIVHSCFFPLFHGKSTPLLFVPQGYFNIYIITYFVKKYKSILPLRTLLDF